MAKIQNKIPTKSNLKRYLMKNDHLMICPRCDGTGTDLNYIELNNRLYEIQKGWERKEDEIIFVNCNKCHGRGYFDWIENATGIIDNDELRPYLSDIENAARAFLCSALYGTRSDFDFADFYDLRNDRFSLFSHLIDVDRGVENLKNQICLVRKYLTDEDILIFRREIITAYRLDGQTCTKCFDLVLDKDLIDKIKKYDKIIPAIPGDEINYYEIIIKDKDYPRFRLCDGCKKRLREKDIIQLKKDAFDPFETWQFSKQYIEKIYSYNDIF